MKWLESPEDLRAIPLPVLIGMVSMLIHILHDVILEIERRREADSQEQAH